MLNREIAEWLKTGKWQPQLFEFIGSEGRSWLETNDVIQLTDALNDVMGVPINFEREMGWQLFDAYYNTAWLGVFEKLGLPPILNVLEVASGDTIHVPIALQMYTHGQGRYVTANLNKGLTESFWKRVANLTIYIRLIEDNASNIEQYEPAESFDLIALQHAVNDIIQTIVAEELGIDTVHNDWMAILPDMAHGVTWAYQNGTLERIAYAKFIALLQGCYQLLRPGGYMVFNHCVFQVDLDCGYELDLYANYIFLAREWIARSDLDIEVIERHDFDPRWWLIVRKP